MKRRTQMILAVVIILSLLTNPLTTMAAPVDKQPLAQDVGHRMMALRDRIQQGLQTMPHQARASTQVLQRSIHDLPKPPRLDQRPTDQVAITEQQLRQLGIPERDAQAQVYASDLSDPFNPINAYATYGQISGASATDLGLVYSGGLAPGWQSAAQFCPQCYDPYYYSRGADTSFTVAQALNSSNDSANYALNLLNSINGGTFNQFTGQLTAPYGWYAGGFENQYYGAANYGTLDVGPSTLAVLGYDSSSPYNFTTQFLTNFNSYLYEPWNTGWQWQTGVVAAGAPQRAIDEIQTRFATIGSQQLDLFYQSAGLSDLRIESNAVLMLPLYTDPEYLYWSYLLEYVLSDIYQSYCATYPALIAQEQSMAAWQPTTDTAELERRANERLYYLYLQGIVEAEAQTVIANNAALQTWLGEVDVYLDWLVLNGWGSTELNTWFAGWQGAWFDNYEAGVSPIEQAINQLMADYPALKEYLDLNREVIQLSQAFTTTQPVQALTSQIASVLENPTVANTVSSAYNTYKNQLQVALDNTQFTAAAENYQEQIDALVANDPLYVAMKTIEYQIVLTVRQFQYDVALAVDNCYTQYGNNCNAYTDPNVQAVLNSVDLTTLLGTLGAFYELNTLFWYTFYEGTGRGAYPASTYPIVEEQAATQIEQTVAAVEPQVEAAQTTFNTTVNNVPDVNAIKISTDGLLKNLRGKGVAQRSDDGLMDERTQLDTKLTRMSVLATQLRNTTVAPATQKIYLPLVRR